MPRPAYGALFVIALIDLVTLTFDLLTSKVNRFTDYQSDGLPSCQFWASRPFRSGVRSSDATDGQTDVVHHFIILLLTVFT